LTQFNPPIVQQPKLISETSTSEVPNFRYSMVLIVPAVRVCRLLPERAGGCASPKQRYTQYMTKEPLAVRELNHVALHVRDLSVSEHFYEHVLGLPRIPRPAFSFPGAWFALGKQELHLIVDDVHQDDERHSVHFALCVEDAYAAYTTLVESGVPAPSIPAPRPDGAVQVFFKDPDGFLIEMVSFPNSL
jgi:catechol 2,3-dioxygenase-like lactoylglutathione lyase family enzyme